jgi:TRAP-type C4-dicarboxylate transport system permease small subunit
MNSNSLLSNLLIFGSPSLAIITLAITAYGWIRYHGKSKPWWLWACAVILVITLALTGYLVYEFWQVASNLG